MAVTATAVSGEIDTFLRDIAGVSVTSGLSNVPLLGNLSLPAGTGFFQQLRTDVAAALSGVADDADAIVNALKTVPGLTASVSGGNINIGIDADSAVDLGNVSVGFSSTLSGLGLDALGQFATKLNASLDTSLRFDGATGQLAMLDNAVDELTVSITSDLSAEAHGKLGVIDVKIEDAGAPDTEIQLEVAIDLPTGDAGNAGGATVQNVTGDAGLDLQITSTIAKFLPTITTDLVVDFAPDVGTAPTIALNNISIDVGGLFDIFGGTLKEVSELLDTAPLGEFIDLTTGALPVVDSLAEKFGLEDALDPVPALTKGDGNVSLADLIALQNTLGGGAPNAFLEGVAIIGMIRALGADGPDDKITLGNIAVSDNKAFTSLVGDKGTDELDAIVDAANVFGKLGLDAAFSSKSGLSIPLLNEPGKIVDLLLGNSPVTLVEYNLPDLEVEGRAGVFVPLLGPLGLTFTGGAKDTKTDFVLGYDTLGITSGDFDQGFYLRSGDGGTQVATVHTFLEAGAALHAVVIEASATGSLNFQVNANLDDPDGDGKVRLADPGCLFDLDGKATVSVQVEIKIDFGLFSFTKRIPILSEVIADYDLTHCDPLTTPPGKEGLASVIGTDLVLNTGNRADLRFLNDGKPGDDATQPEFYQIVHGATTDTLDIVAFGGKQSFGSATSPLFFIRGDLGDLDDSLSIAEDIGRWSNITGGKGNDFISGGAGRDTFDGGEGDDFLIGNDGDDVLSGGGGRDEFDGGKGADKIDGGAERDRVSYEDSSDTGVKFVRQNGQLVGFGGEAEGDTLKNIEYLVGTKFADQLVGNPSESSTLEGLGGNDTLIGGAAGDYLLGGAGGDVIDGAGGEDGTSYLTSFAGVHIDMQRRIFFGGDAEGDKLIGVEQVQGSAYNDVIFGDGGKNLIDGFFGDDRLSGGAGKDVVAGGIGNDVVFAFGDGDKLDGGGSIDDPGIDLLSYSALTGTGVSVNLRTGGAPDAIVSVETGRSTFENLEGTHADDALTGDIGYNTIWGLSGNDKINGDDGNDTLIGGLGADTLDGGKGIDLADYSESILGVDVNLATGKGFGGAAEGDTLVLGTIEDLRGSALTDKLTGDGRDNRIESGLSQIGSADSVQGGAGNDTLIVNYSVVDVGKGLIGGFGLGFSNTGVISREQATSAVTLDSVEFSGIERLEVTGTSHDDAIYGGGKADILSGGSGNDVIFGGAGKDQVFGDDGNDFVAYGTDANRVLSAAGSPTTFGLDGGSGIDVLSISLAGFTDNVKLIGSAPGTEISGTNLSLASTGAGIRNFEILADVITGAGNDRVEQAGSVDNHITTGAGDDLIASGLGVDQVDGGFDDSEVVNESDLLYLTGAIFENDGDLLRLDYSSSDVGVTGTTESVAGLTARIPIIVSVGDPMAELCYNEGTYTAGANKVDFTEIERLDVTGSSQDDLLTGTYLSFTSFLNNYNTTGRPVLRGDDVLRGGGGNDVLRGFSGDDSLIGGDGNDVLVGGELYDLAQHQQFDGAEVDLLNGGKGADLFVLGDSSGSYYTNFGSSSNPNRAVIADLNAFEGDQVQLRGTATEYRVESDGTNSFIYRLAPSGTDLVDELIGEVQNVSDFDLSAAYVIYSGAAGTFEPTLQLLSAPVALQSTVEPGNEGSALESSSLETLAEPVQALAARDFDAAPQQDLLGALGPTSGLLNLKINVSGSSEAIGAFKDDPFGLGEGIVLSTGRVSDLIGPNTIDGSILPQLQANVGFADIGRIGVTQVYKADLSQLGIDINSLVLRDNNLKNAGVGGDGSGFDLDFVILSTKELSPADLAVATPALINTLPRLDVFDYSAAAITFEPGTQRGNAAESLSGASGKLVLDSGHLALLDADGFTDIGNITLGDGGAIKFDLKETVNTDGPLYLYVGENGAVGETVTGSLSVSPAFVQPDGDLSTDLGAPGLADDTTRMTMSFTPGTGLNQVQFQFVLFSEELTEFGGAALPDTVKILVNGIDFARLSDGASATLDNLMMSPYGPVHPDLVLNPAGTGPAADTTRADAYTRLITVTVPVTPGVENVIEIEAADHRDAFLDSGIMLKAGSFAASAGSMFPNGIAALPAFEEAALVLGPSGPTVIVSADVTGNEGNKDSGFVGNDIDISGDGRFVVFGSNANNLVPDDANGYYDIFVKDLESNSIERISVSAGGAQSNSFNSSPTISGDGRYVAFLSGATNLGVTNPTGFNNLFVKDRLTGATVWSSSIPNFSSASDIDAAISQDGRHVVFTTAKEPSPVGNFAQDVFVLDLTTGVFSPASTLGVGTAANDDSGEASISGDGRYVVFSSTATNLAAGDGNGFQADIFLKDMASGDIRLVSTDVNGLGGNLASGRPVISNDGRYVAFYSNANNLVAGDTNGATDVFRKDLLTGEIVRANTTSAGVQGNAGFGIDANSYLSMSGDGRFIAFYSANTNLVPGSGGGQVFVKDLNTGAIAAVTIGETGTVFNAASILPEISADGRYIAISTGAQLVAGDTNGAYDVFRVPNPLFSAIAAPQVSIDDLTVFENTSGTTTATFTITRSGGSAPFSVEFATSNGTATAGEDYVAAAGKATFAANQETATVSIVINGDNNYGEGNETFFVDLLNPTSGATITDGHAQAIIINAPDPRTTIVSDGSGDTADVTIPENASAVTTVFARTLGAPASLVYSIIDGADKGKFGIDPLTGVLGFVQAPDFEAKSDSDQDNIYEVTVKASDGLTSDTQTILVHVANVIEGGELAGTVAISDVSITEGNAGTRFATFTVTRSGGTAAFDVSYATADGTASAGSDYVGIAATVLSFGSNEISKEIAITINGDLDFEPNETFFVNLSNPTNGATITDGQGQGAIENDDSEPAGTVAISDVTITEGDAGTKIATFTITRSGGTAAFDVTYATADGSASAGTDYAGIPPTSVSFGQGETSKQVSVTINGDLAFEPNETFFVNLSNPTNAAVFADGQGQGTIENDDAEPAGTVAIGDVTIAEGDAGTKVATFTIMRSGGTAAFDVSYETVDGTASAGSDYVGIAATTLSFAQNETSKQISVTINGDLGFEPNETFLVNLSSPTNGAVIADGQGQGTIENDDAEPTGSVTISEAVVTEGDAGTKVATFTVTRTGGTGAFDLTYATKNGTASAGSDYVGIAVSTLGFGQNETSKQISVTINGDTTFEPNETFFVMLSNPTNGAVIADGQGQGTIENDDIAAIIGTNRTDVLDGTRGNDVIIALAGLDLVFAGGGDDVIKATINDGADLYDGGAGRDTIDYFGLTAGVTVTLDPPLGFGPGCAQGSQSGIDFLFSIENAIGSQAADSITGSDGANTLEGRGGNDVMSGRGGADILDGGAGNDTLTGGQGSDNLRGDAGDDVLDGGAGKDVVAGDVGRDSLRWGAGDTLDGGAGLDVLLYADSGDLNFSPLNITSIEAINLGVGDNNNNGIVLSLADVLDLAATSSGTGLSANGDAIDLFIFGDNAGAVRDNVTLTGGWAASGTITTSDITGASATFQLYLAGGSQIAVQQNLDTSSLP